MLRLMSSDGKAEKERNSMIYKFDKKELTQKGQYFKIPGPGFLPRYQTPISPREDVYKRQEPGWLCKRIQRSEDLRGEPFQNL